MERQRRPGFNVAAAPLGFSLGWVGNVTTHVFPGRQADR